MNNDGTTTPVITTINRSAGIDTPPSSPALTPALTPTVDQPDMSSHGRSLPLPLREGDDDMIGTLVAAIWETLITSWIDYLRAAGSPESTIDLRRYHITRLATAFPNGPCSVTFNNLVRWLSSHRWAPNTRRSYRGSLRAFYRWAMDTGVVSESPAHLLPPVRVPRPRPRPAPEEAFRWALEIADDRARLAIMLAGMCGLRRGEIARAHTDDIEPDLAGLSIRVRGKGDVVRIVPLPDVIAADVLGRSAGWLFPSSHGGHLTPHHLGKVVSANLPGTLATHSLRHRCATVAYANTRDLRAVQELLGHAKPETTAIYTAVPDDAVRAAMQAAARGALAA